MQKNENCHTQEFYYAVLFNIYIFFPKRPQCSNYDEMFSESEISFSMYKRKQNNDIDKMISKVCSGFLGLRSLLKFS